jgi:8-oxo-dGTP pyrophosphatase MutT (NUDIX family)
MQTRGYRRRSARVLLLDAADRLLLLHSLHRAGRPDLGSLWLAPGGGVQDGEDLRDAAARELREEVGLRVHPGELGRHVAFVEGYAELSGASEMFRDDFFLHRVEDHDVVVADMEEYERSTFLGHRWWPIEQLAITDETVYPLELAALLRQAIVQAPDAPVHLPWRL